MTLTAFTPLTLGVAPSPPSCHGGSNGSINLNVNNGTAIDYIWSNGATTQDLSSLYAGTYTVTVTDSNGCTKTISATVTEPGEITFSKAITNVSCNAGTNGTIGLTPSGGTPGSGPSYNYKWSDGPTTQNRSNLSAGTYTVTVTDSKGCTKTNSSTVTQPPALALTDTTTHVSCFAGANGTINLVVAGGTGGRTFLWNDSVTTEDRSNLMAGTYSVRVTDANGCTKTDTTIVTQPPALALSDTTAHVSCFAGANGAINLVVTGGTGNRTFLWNDSTTTEDRTNLTAGTYSVRVTDANGCTKTDTTAVTQPPALALSDTTAHVSCFAGANGAINLVVAGGTGNRSFLWNDSITTEDRSNLAAGTYSVRVTDANGCTKTDTTAVTQPPALALSDTTAHVSCFAGANGAINLVVTGGTGNRSFLWNDSITTEDRANLTAGIYSVRVTDANGCTKTDTTTVTQPTALTASRVVTNVSCFAGANGAINLTASGATPPYTYKWSDGPTTEDRTNLTATTYTVTVTDSKMCTETSTATVTQPTELTASATATNLLCFGLANGTATAATSGGTGTATFLWSNGQTAQTATGLSAGPYTVTATDANGCTKTATATVAQPDALTASATATSVSCFGFANGTATAAASGGTGTATFLWSNGQTAKTATGLITGLYTVTATDANGCTKTATATVAQPDALTASATATDVSCFGLATGTATAATSGGTGAITFLWSNGQTAKTATGLVAGLYTITATDANGCTKTATATVSQPAELTASATATSVSCFGFANGTATAATSGGTGTATFLWSNGQAAKTATGLIAGTYSVTATDLNGCTKTATATVSQPTVLTASATATAVSCFGLANATATAATSGGTGAITFLWSNGQTAKTATGLIAGTYTVTATDANGCTKTATATVGQPAALTASATATDVSCFGANNGTATAATSGGTGTVTFLWSNGQTAKTATGLVAGMYTVTATDANGCTQTATTTVGQPTALTASATFTNVTCFGLATGTATAAASGGTGTATFLWSNGQTAKTATGLIAGLYTITATDANGCTKTATATVSQPDALMLTVDKVTDATSGSSNGAVDITATGATPPYTFAWKHLESGTVYTTEDLQNIPAGHYELTLKDGNGCTATTTAEVKEVSATGSPSGMADWHLFPNPNDGRFVVKGDLSPYPGSLKLQIFSAIGGYQATFIPSALDLSNGFEVAMENAQPGMYCIQLWSEDVLLGCRLFLAAHP